MDNEVLKETTVMHHQAPSTRPCTLLFNPHTITEDVFYHHKRKEQKYAETSSKPSSSLEPFLSIAILALSWKHIFSLYFQFGS